MAINAHSAASDCMIVIGIHIQILTTVVISDGVEKHSPVRCHFDGLVVLRLKIAAAVRCANDLVFR